MARLNQDLAEHRADIDAVLDRNGREAAALALQGTPAFIINGNLIPGGMPQAVIDLLELIQVQGGQGHRLPFASGAGQLPGQGLIQVAAVVESGQGVPDRLHPQLLRQREQRRLGLAYPAAAASAG